MTFHMDSLLNVNYLPANVVSTPVNIIFLLPHTLLILNLSRNPSALVPLLVVCQVPRFAAVALFSNPNTHIPHLHNLPPTRVYSSPSSTNFNLTTPSSSYIPACLACCPKISIQILNKMPVFHLFILLYYLNTAHVTETWLHNSARDC